MKEPILVIMAAGTGHAILSCDGLIDAPFAVINSDDYYGREAFKLIYDFLSTVKDNEKYQYSMVGYKLGNTLTDFGSFARGDYPEKLWE